MNEQILTEAKMRTLKKEIEYATKSIAELDAKILRLQKLRDIDLLGIGSREAQLAECARRLAAIAKAEAE